MPKILSNDDVALFRERLCDLALKAFVQGGAEAVSLRRLATEAGCSRSTPYRYFKNKAAILAAVRQMKFGQLAEAMERAVESGANSQQKLRALAEAYFRFAQQNPDAYRLMYEFNQRDEHLYPDLVTQIERTQQVTLDAVAAAVQDGDIEGDPVNIASTLWAALHGLNSLHLADKLKLKRDFRELSEVMIRSLERAIATNPSKKSATRRLSARELRS